TDSMIEKVVSTSAARVMEIVSREGIGDGKIQPAARLSLELSSPSVPQSAPSRAAGSQSEIAGPQTPMIPASRVLDRVAGERTSSATTDSTPDATSRTGPAPATTRAPAAAAAVAADPSVPAAGGKAQIEKQVRQPTARELADNEYRKGANA